VQIASLLAQFLFWQENFEDSAKNGRRTDLAA